MMRNSKSSPGVFTSLAGLVLGCFSLVTLCGWILHWCLNVIPVRHVVLAVFLMLLGGMALVWKAWRTRQHTSRLLHLARVPVPGEISTRLVNFGLHPAYMVLIQSDQPVALCFGFLKPRICLSTGLLELLSQTQLKATLMHEDYHRQRHDPLRLLFIESIATALFFLPVVQEWRKAARLRLELDADRYAVQQAGRGALAGALYRMLSTASSAPTAGVVTAGLNASTLRIAVLLGDERSMQQVSVKSILYSTFILWILCVVLMK